MDQPQVYRPTTEDASAPNGPGRGPRGVFSGRFFLDRPSPRRAPLKLAELVLSLVAFICEEIVSHCTQCGGLYFFEFISCSASLLSLLVVIVYCTSLYEKVDSSKVEKSDFFITLITGSLFLIASIVFAFTSDGTSPETAAIVFGFLTSLIFGVDFVLLTLERRSHSRKSDPAIDPRTTQPLNG